MKRDFKFRYANEIAGTFVLLALLLAIAGIVLTAHYRGWFEKRFTVKLLFETQEGTYGLKEGDEVRVGNTRAGSVKQIVPTEEGKLEASVEIKERFRSMVRKDSVARIKKKFVAAGDTYVEISRGEKLPVEEGEYIEVVREQELMDRLQQTLDKFEETALPMLDETKGILKHVNSILKSVDTGKGIAGAVINNNVLRDEAAAVVKNMDQMSSDLTNTVHKIDLIVESIENGEGIAGMLAKDKELADSAREAVHTAVETAEEARRTLRESRRLVEGLQKHWLVRKYIKDKDEIEAVPTVYLRNTLKKSAADYRAALKKARLRNDSKDIAEFAYKLAVYHYLAGNLDRSLRLNREAAVELDRLEEETTWTRLLEAAVQREQGRSEEAAGILKKVLEDLRGWSYDRQARLYGHALSLSLYSEDGDAERASEQADAVKSFVRREDSQALRAVAYNALATYHRKQQEQGEAAEYAIKAAESLASLNNYEYMRKALVVAAEALRDAGREREATHRYLQAARSYAAEEGNSATVQRLMDEATECARLSGSAKLLELALALRMDEGATLEN